MRWRYLSFPPKGVESIEDESDFWEIRFCKYPNCDRIIVELGKGEKKYGSHLSRFRQKISRLLAKIFLKLENDVLTGQFLSYSIRHN